MSLEIKDKLETGRKFFRISGSSSSFLIRGTMSASFSLDGTSLVLRERFTMCVITGTNSSRHNFKSHVGMGSRSQDFEVHLVMRRLILMRRWSELR